MNSVIVALADRGLALAIRDDRLRIVGRNAASMVDDLLPIIRAHRDTFTRRARWQAEITDTPVHVRSTLLRDTITVGEQQAGAGATNYTSLELARLAGASRAMRRLIHAIKQTMDGEVVQCA